MLLSIIALCCDCQIGFRLQHSACNICTPGWSPLAGPHLAAAGRLGGGCCVDLQITIYACHALHGTTFQLHISLCKCHRLRAS